MTRPRSARRAGVALLAALLWAGASLASPLVSSGATPASGTLTAPDSGKAVIAWSGSILPGASSANGTGLRCFAGTNPTADGFSFTIALPSGDATFYATHTARLTITVSWTPTVSANANNLALTTDFTPTGGSATDISDAGAVGTTTLTAVYPNPKSKALGNYDAGVCAAANSTPQPYSATATLEVVPIVAGTVATVSTTAVDFAPATIVSPTILGAEPQVTSERVLPTSQPGRLDPNRVFIDWPNSTAQQTSILTRSTDGGTTFRPLLDPLCYTRNRPNCLTAGGGDSVNRVNLYDGTVYFGDQEVVLAEAVASSNDHGDTFPAAQQFAATAASTGVDRQWITTVDKPGLVIAGREIRAFYSYHIPSVGVIVASLDTNGLPVAPPVPQVLGVSQSGPNRFDSTGGPGDGYLYLSYRDGTGMHVASVKGTDYLTSSAYHIGTVSSDVPAIFPWISLDSHGNLYAVWVTNGVVSYSYSLIDDPANNPARGGAPASKWAQAVAVQPHQIGSAVFPEIAAGDPGRAAITYAGTIGYTGASDGAPPFTDAAHPGAPWSVYSTIVTDGLALAGPTLATGTVSHRPVHYGTVCTGGTLCSGDRSLLDMIDVTVDQDGRAGIVFTDNNSTFGVDSAGGTVDGGSPFVKFAKETRGPSLWANHAPIAVPSTSAAYRSAPRGNATWPNVAGATNLPGLDETGAALFLDGSDVVARIDLADASPSATAAALTAYNAASPTQAPAQRLQYTLRWENGRDVYHLDMEQLSDGTRNFFGSKLIGADSVTETSVLVGSGVAYNRNATTPLAVTGTVVGNSIYIRGKASDFLATAGSPAYSVTAFAMAGQAEANDTLPELSTRTVDATPPFDARLSAGEPVAATTTPPVVAPIPAVTPSVPNTAGSGAPAGAAAAAAFLAGGGLVVGRRRRGPTTRR